MLSIPQSYTPPQPILRKYAEVLVKFALGNDEGIKKGDVVQCIVPDIAKPLAKELQSVILEQGGHMMLRLMPTGMDHDFYTQANEEQLTFFPEQHVKSRVELVDHSIVIIADPDPHELSDVDPAKIMKARNAQKKLREWLNDKEQQGNFTWTIALWGVEAKAELVGLTLEEYWQQIISACFLDQADPIASWRVVKEKQIATRAFLDDLQIEWLEVKGADVDLKIKLGADRVWKGGADRNIPSFELFTSPDWRGTEGWIQFNQPLYRYGTILEGVELTFAKGKVTKATATKGQSVLEEMLKTENANKIGEFSLTDARFSRITHPMAETLFDENVGGEFGNTHIAIGMAYKDCFRGDESKVTKAAWKKMGFNDSMEHTDIISTTDRTVTALLSDGSRRIIYQHGQFVL